MSPNGEREEGCDEGAAASNVPDALARGLLAEAVDCIEQASHVVGDHESRATLRRFADDLAQFAKRLQRSD